MTRNMNLDLIKCIACFAVVGLHAVGMIDYTVYYLCGCGVPLFFMVNGYLLLSKEQLTYSYICKKILQIIKIVFIWNLLIILPVLLFRHKMVNPVTLSINSLLQKGYLWHFWFFGALLLIYLLLPLFHKFFSAGRYFHPVVVFFCLGCCLFMSIASMINGYAIHAYIPQSLRVWTWLFYFCIGGLIPSLLSHIRKLPVWIHVLLTLSALCINNQALKHIGLNLTGSRIADYYYDNASSILYYLLLFTLLLRISLKGKACKAIVFLSRLTMGIFILHPVLLTGIRAFYSPTGTFAVYVFWPGLTLLSGFITFVMSKCPLTAALIKLK